MREIRISGAVAGQRIDKYILKLLPGMTKNFSYKMYRKKNICLNGNKIGGNELLVEGDLIQIYFSDDTYDTFSVPKEEGVSEDRVGSIDIPLPRVIYEDDRLLVLNKEAGIFSQPDQRGVSINQQIEAHYRKMGTVLEQGFTPGVANRLDRNTSGVILSAKDLPTIQAINGLVMDHQVDKRYRTIVKGQVTEPRVLEGYLVKNSNRNRVSVNTHGEGDYIHTSIRPIRIGKAFTELEVTIKTGKPHQIRAHLASIGHPIVGDGKYGHKDINKTLRKDYGLKHQLLHARFYRFTGDDGLSRAYTEGFTATLPEIYRKVSEGLLGE